MYFVSVVCLLLLAADASLGKVFQPETRGSIVLNESLSSSLLNESAYRTEAECLSWCDDRDCAAALLNETSRVCQLLVINDESSGQLTPEGSHVTRKLVSTADGAVMLWKAEDFELQLRSRRFPTSFSNSSTGPNGSVQFIHVPFSGCYRIEAFGAAGGRTAYSASVRGGKGARAAGSFKLTARTRLDIVVGQAGSDASSCSFGAGGGGGSFVYVSNGTGSPWLLLAAGGGGGSTWSSNGINGNKESAGTNSSMADAYTGAGGIGGQPGQVSPTKHPVSSSTCGGAGAGWSASAALSSVSYVNPGGPGLSRLDGWLGGASRPCHDGDGGFGGGGAGGGCCLTIPSGAGGGGGGFSGGGASSSRGQSGGGGGSYCSGFNCSTATGANLELQGRVLLIPLVGCE